MSSPHPAQQPMIPEPRQPETQWPRREVFGAKGTKWSAYRGKTHVACALCVEVAHERGVAAAPRVQPGTLKRVGPNGDSYYCGPHGAELKRRDAQVDAKLAERAAHGDLLAKADRRR